MQKEIEEKCVKALEDLWAKFGPMHATLPPWQGVQTGRSMIILKLPDDPEEAESGFVAQAIAGIVTWDKTPLEYRANTRLICGAPGMFSFLMSLLARDRVERFLPQSLREQAEANISLILSQEVEPVATSFRLVDMKETY